MIRATGLVPLAARAVRELIRGLRDARRSVVLCTHDLDEAERLADTVAILSRGRPVACDAAAVLPTSAAAGLLLLDGAIAVLAAATWRREDVLANR